MAAQFERNLWPTQKARHLAFLVVTAVAIATVCVVAGKRHRLPRLSSARLVSAGVGLVLLGVVLAGGFVLQRHYFHLRYRVGDRSDPGLASIYAWAQTIRRSRVALYGNVEQYPLYGATDSNRVTYLGRHTSDGGFAPISSCIAWQRALRLGDYRYVVLTAGPTASIPIAWTAQDPNVKPILHPATQQWVFETVARSPATRCD